MLVGEGEGWYSTGGLYTCVHMLFIPLQRNDEDVSQFDTRFTKLTPIDSPVDTKISTSADMNFQVGRVGDYK